MHWHSHAVKSLYITPDSTQILSGGEEGVIVFWHLVLDKKTFCPRIGTGIIGLTVDPTRTIVACLTDSNQVR